VARQVARAQSSGGAARSERWEEARTGVVVRWRRNSRQGTRGANPARLQLEAATFVWQRRLRGVVAGNAAVRVAPMCAV